MESLAFDFTDTQLVAGVDEVGRGPLIGDVVAAAVILDPSRPIEGLTDSKKLSEKKRERLALEIRERALAWAVASASPAEIDELNILHASMLAMRRAGARTFGQTREDCVVWGMPRAALQVGAVETETTLSAMAGAILAASRGKYQER